MDDVNNEAHKKDGGFCIRLIYYCKVVPQETLANMAVTQIKKKTPLFSSLSLSENHKKLSVDIYDVSVSVVNALRRTIITDIPSAAFEFDPTYNVHTIDEHEKISAAELRKCGIVVRKNSSPTHNEMLAGRLALVPICVNERQLVELSKNPDMFSFVIRVKNDSAQVRVVTTRDIQVNDNQGRPVDAQIRDGLFPACDFTGDHIILTKLGQASKYHSVGETEPEIHIEAVATVGSESSHGHSKWCPVSVCYFVNSVDKEAADAAFAACRPPVSRSQFDALEGLRHFHTDEFGEANKFQFRLESECGLRAPYLFFMGFRVLINRVKTLRRAIEMHDHEKVAIASLAEIAAAKNDPTSKFAVTNRSEMSDDYDDMFNVIVSHEDHTLGNLVQTMMYDRHLKTQSGSSSSPSPSRTASDILYIGYHQPHPLESCIIFRVKITSQKATKTAVEAFFVSDLAWIESILQGYSDEWIKFTGMQKSFTEEYGIDKTDT